MQKKLIKWCINGSTRYIYKRYLKLLDKSSFMILFFKHLKSSLLVTSMNKNVKIFAIFFLVTYNSCSRVNDKSNMFSSLKSSMFSSLKKSIQSASNKNVDQKVNDDDSDLNETLYNDTNDLPHQNIPRTSENLESKDSQFDNSQKDEEEKVDTFNIKHSKSKPKQNIDNALRIFDPAKINAYLERLKHLLSLVSLKNNTKLRESYIKTQRYMTNFSEQITLEMSTAFENIRNKVEVQKNVLIFKSKLEEIISYQKEYPFIFEFFSKGLITEWKFIIYTSYYNELVDKKNALAQNKEIIKLESVYEIVRKLKILDSYFDSNLCTQLAEEIFQSLLVGLDSEERAVKKYIDSKQYMMAGNQLSKMNKNSAIFNRLQLDLANSIRIFTKTLSMEIRVNLDKVDIHRINDIIQGLISLEEAKVYVFDYLGDKSKVQIKKDIEQIKTIFSSKLKGFIDSLSGAVRTGNYKQALITLKSILKARDLVSDHCPKTVLDEIGKVKKQLEDRVRAEINAIKDRKMEDFLYYPPKEIYDKFFEASKFEDEYKNHCEEIKRILQSKVTENLQSLRKISDELRYSDRVSNLKTYVAALPDILRPIITHQIKLSEDRFKNVYKSYKNELEAIIKNKDLDKIKLALAKYEKRNLDELKHLLINVIKEDLDDFLLVVQESIACQDTNVVEHIKKIASYGYHFNKFTLVPLLKYYSTIKNLISKNLQEQIHLIDKVIENQTKNCNPVDLQVVKQNVKRACKALQKVQYLIFVKIGVDKIAMGKENWGAKLIPDQLGNDVDVLNKKISKFIKSKDLDVDILRSNNVSKLQDKMNDIEMWEEFVMTTANYSRDCAELGIDVQNLNRSLKNTGNTKKIFKQIEGLSENIDLPFDDSDFLNKINSNLLQEFSKKLKLFRDIGQMSNNSGKLAKQKYQQNIKSLNDKIKTIEDDINEILSKDIFEMRIKDYDLINSTIKLFRCIKDITKDHKGIKTNKCLNSIENKVIHKCRKIKDSSKEHMKENEEVAKIMIAIKTISDNLPVYKKELDAYIDDVVGDYTKSNGGVALLELSKILTTLNDNVGNNIVKDHKKFKGIKNLQYRTKIKAHSLEDLGGITFEGIVIDKEDMTTKVDKFYAEYDELLKHYLVKNANLMPVISEIKAITGAVKQKNLSGILQKGKLSDIEFPTKFIKDIPSVMAKICTLWTYQESADQFFAMDGSDLKDKFLLRPHVGQVMAIMRLLGIIDDPSTSADTNNGLCSNLVQILTGEGKSVIIAITTSILGLIGCDVNCACYSKYLSERDFNNFTKLFSDLGILDRIEYGTFQKICEIKLNNGGSIRKKVENYIFKNSEEKKENLQDTKDGKSNDDKAYRSFRPSVLIVDEVDVLLNKEFFGNCYAQSITLKDDDINALIKEIWEKRNQDLNLKKIREFDGYKKCMTKMPKWKFLLDEACKKMMADLGSYKNHKYTIYKDKIGYKIFDNIFTNIKEGYMTLFAYFQEHDNGNISKASLEENIGIDVMCGNFSYAEMPKYYSLILGVTGTLANISAIEKQKIKELYSIEKFTYCPSVFGQNNCKFPTNINVTIEDEKDYNNIICRRISDGLQGATGQRSVLVFFEDNDKLKEFEKIKDLDIYRDVLSVLDESLDTEDKDKLIRRAATSGMVTFAPRTFGRGTDFMCSDKMVDSNGGIAVIQTFLSEELSEEVQIKGRTARQGNQGTFEIRIQSQQLEPFGIPLSKIDDYRKTDVYAELNKKREEISEKNFSDKLEALKEATKDHEKSRQFLVDLAEDNFVEIKKYILELNRGPAEAKVTKLAVLMDATGSMGGLIKMAKLKVKEVFIRTLESLREKKLNLDIFQIRFVAYRSCYSKENIYQESPWTNTSAVLQSFMNGVKASGGCGPEDLQVALQMVDDSVQSVILIGDAPPTPVSKVLGRRARYHGEHYWSGTKFATPTDYIKESNRLKGLGIKVNTFYLEDRAKDTFEEIAKITDGVSYKLDVNSSSGADELLSCVTQLVLEKVGDENGIDLLSGYKAKYKTYI